VQNVNMVVDKGEFVAIMGPSGSGKSTLLSLLGGLDRPQSGDVLLSGQRYSTLSEGGLARIRRYQVGFVFQFFNLIAHLTALENVVLPMRFGKMSRRAMLARADHLLETVGLSHRKNHKPLELSGGEQQRSPLQGLWPTNRPSYWRMSPQATLTPRHPGEIGEVFHRLNEENGQTFVVVTHDASLRKWRTGPFGCWMDRSKRLNRAGSLTKIWGDAQGG
jgi:ABC-type lipoprotein export system ATPase subunit